MSVTRPWPGNRSRPRCVVGPRVFRAPEGPAAVCVGGRRPASLMVLLVAPRVFRAPEGPAAVRAGGRRPAREPSALRASLGASPRSPARPRRRPPAPRQIPPAPFTPVGPGVLTCACASSRSPARPRYRPRAPQPGPMDPQCGLACCAGILGRSAACCYKRRQSEGFFAENQGFWTQIDDVCNMSTRKGGSNCSGLTTFVTSAAHWSPGQALPPPTII